MISTRLITRHLCRSLLNLSIIERKFCSKNDTSGIKLSLVLSILSKNGCGNFSEKSRINNCSMHFCRSTSTSPTCSTFTNFYYKRPKLDPLPLVKKQPRNMRRRTLLGSDLGRGPFVCAVPFGQSVNLAALSRERALTDIYEVTFASDEDSEGALHLVPLSKYQPDPDTLREVFIFSDGVAVYWNVHSPEQSQIYQQLYRHTDGLYPIDYLVEEEEKMPFKFVNEGKTGIRANNVYLNVKKFAEQWTASGAVNERLAISHAIAVSVKIGVWETQLETISDPMSETALALKSGRISVTAKQVLVKAGELAMLRNLINLNCDLLSLDEFYWDHDTDLARIYEPALRYFDTRRRLDRLNRKIDYCEQMTGRIDSILSHRQSVRLEWLIIVLIFIEVFFEIVYTLEKQQIISFPLGVSPSE